MSAASWSAIAAEQVLAVLGAGEIQNVRPGLQTGAGDRRLVGLDGNRNACRVEGPDHRQQFGLLGGRIQTGGVRQGQFCAHINDVGPLGLQDLAPPQGALGGETDALPVPMNRARDLITPMIAGRELKARCLPPMANSFTRACAAARFFSNSSARYSSVSMELTGPPGLPTAG